MCYTAFTWDTVKTTVCCSLLLQIYLKMTMTSVYLFPSVQSFLQSTGPWEGPLAAQ